MKRNALLILVATLMNLQTIMLKEETRTPNATDYDSVYMTFKTPLCTGGSVVTWSWGRDRDGGPRA